MPLFQLAPEDTAARVRSSASAPTLPTLTHSLLRGMIGFAIVSVAGFSPWPVMGAWFRSSGEIALYVACTVVFIALSGPCLHRLILGPGSLWRFYALFTPAFVTYAIVWVVCWRELRGELGQQAGIVGLLGGTAVMGIILVFAFGAYRQLLPVILSLFLLNTAGYCAGEWLEGIFAWDLRLAGMLSWGLCYGLGFGAGLGLAFHFCQTRTRALLIGTAGESRV